MSLLKNRTRLVLLTGLLGLGFGLGLMLLPLRMPSLPVGLWSICYWCGGALMIAGGLITDVALLYAIMHRLLTGSGNAERA